MYTKAISLVIFLAVWFFSFVVSIVFIWILDSVWVFKVYKLGRVLTGSFHTYFLVFLIVGTVLLIDVAILVLGREFNPPIYILFKSLMRKKGIKDEARERMFDTLVQGYKATGVISSD